MKKMIVLTAVLISFFLFTSDGFSENAVYYARCNLKILKGRLITWVNWQASPEFIPVNTKLRVVSEKKVINLKTNKEYALDLGAKGSVFLEKFVVKDPIKIEGFPADAQEGINKALARIGMTKEAVYISMGPPSWITTGKTYNKTYEDIMASDLWVYKRRRFGKNIGVAFDSITGQVNRTEGIWGE